MAVIKAGIYRFKDTLTPRDDIEVNIKFTIEEWFGYKVDGTKVSVYETDPRVVEHNSIKIYETGGVFKLCFDGNIARTMYDDNSGWNAFADNLALAGTINTSICNGCGQTITVLEDTEVGDFAPWFADNTTSPLVEIIYNGEIIAPLNAGQVATLECAGQKMATNVVVKANIPDGAVICSGNHVIEVDVLPTSNIDETSIYFCQGKYYSVTGDEIGRAHV